MYATSLISSNKEAYLKGISKAIQLKGSSCNSLMKSSVLTWMLNIDVEKFYNKSNKMLEIE